VGHVDEYRRLLDGVLSAMRRDLSLATFDHGVPQQLTVACLYATIYESALESRDLLKNASVTTVGGVLRSVLESYADLCAVIIDPR
jgi:hypothetical protein